MEIEHEYTDVLVCPYCGHEQSDTWELPESSDDYQCGSCSKNFSFDSYTTRTFTSSQVPCLNGEPHSWEPLFLPMQKYPDAVRCKMCRKRDYRVKK